MIMFDKLYTWLLSNGFNDDAIISWTPLNWAGVLFTYLSLTGNLFPVSLVPQFVEDLKERRSMRLLRGGAPLGDLGPEHEATELDFVFCKREGMEVETYDREGTIYCSACHACLGQDGLPILVKESNDAISRVVIR